MARTEQTSPSACLQLRSYSCPCPALPLPGPELAVPEAGLPVGLCSLPGPGSSQVFEQAHTLVKGAGLVVLQDKIVCQGFVGGSLADAGRKTNCKDGKRRRKKMPQGKQHWQETELLVGEGHSETNLHSTSHVLHLEPPLTTLTCVFCTSQGSQCWGRLPGTLAGGGTCTYTPLQTVLNQQLDTGWEAPAAGAALLTVTKPT